MHRPNRGCFFIQGFHAHALPPLDRSLTQYMMRIPNIIDLLAIAPYYLSLVQVKMFLSSRCEHTGPSSSSPLTLL